MRVNVYGWLKKLPDMVLCDSKITLLLKETADTVICCGCAERGCAELFLPKRSAAQR